MWPISTKGCKKPFPPNLTSTFDQSRTLHRCHRACHSGDGQIQEIRSKGRWQGFSSPANTRHNTNLDKKGMAGGTRSRIATAPLLALLFSAGSMLAVPASAFTAAPMQSPAISLHASSSLSSSFARVHSRNDGAAHGPVSAARKSGRVGHLTMAVRPRADPPQKTFLHIHTGNRKPRPTPFPLPHPATEPRISPGTCSDQAPGPQVGQVVGPPPRAL